MEQSVNHRGAMIDTFSGALNLVQTKISCNFGENKDHSMWHSELGLC